jgi:flagella basal body P-ring formation protein FlgA
MRLILALGCLLIAAAPAAARAADVALKPAPASHGAAIRLGDLFDGAGAAADEVVAPAAAPGGQAVLDAARVQVAAKRAGLIWANPEGRRRVVVEALGEAASGPAAAPAAARAAAPRGRRQALAYSRNLNPGELIAASDLLWSDEAVAPGDAPADADAVIGKAARRPLRAGAAVALHDLASARLIKRDDLVAVAFDDGGISLILQARALGEGGLGDTLQLVNLQSKKVLEAVVTGPDKAVVGPAADRLKAQTYDPLHLAAR